MKSVRELIETIEKALRNAGRDRPGALSAACAAAILAIGVLDALSGYEFGLSPLYLVPITTAAFFVGGRAGLANSLLSAVTWYLAEIYSQHPYQYALAIYWNTGVRLLIFVLISVTLTRLRTSFAVEKAQSEKLAELNELKNQFVGVVAHDLRTPLAVIHMYTDFIGEKQGTLSNERQLAFLRVIRDRTDFMLRLVEDLLDLAAIESGKLTLAAAPHDYLAFLREQLAVLNALAEKREIRIALEGDGVPPLVFDREKLQQVLSNLVMNALKFAPAGSTIVVSAAVENDRVVTRVTDDGPGIPASELPRIFVPFHKTSVSPSRGDKGAGLGLTIVKKIVEAHHGEVGVTSEPGKGSCFFYTLPLGT